MSFALIFVVLHSRTNLQRWVIRWAHMYPCLLQPCLDQVFSRCWIKNALRIRQHWPSKVFTCTINNQDLSRDEAGGVAEQENRRIGDISGISLATRGKGPIVLALRRKAILALSPCDRARCDDIRAYAMRAFFHSEDGRCRIYGGLRGGNMYLIRGSYNTGSDATVADYGRVTRTPIV
jgi:hypothetical protein